MAASLAEETAEERSQSFAYMWALGGRIKLPRKPKQTIDLNDQKCIALTLYGEGGNSNRYPDTWREGYRAVAITMKNNFIAGNYSNWRTMISKCKYKGYSVGIKAEKEGTLDPTMYAYALKLATWLCTGNYYAIEPPDGISTQTQFRSSKHMKTHYNPADGTFLRSSGNRDPIYNVVEIGGNVFFNYAIAVGG